MAIAAAMTHSERGTSTKYVGRVIAAMQKLSDDDLVTWLKPEHDRSAWQEEVISQWFSHGKAQTMPEGEVAKDCIRRLRAVCELLRWRLFGADRPKRTTGLPAVQVKP
jgi:hypothetical protein